MSEDRGPGISGLSARAYRIPTDKPEADGTASWNATTLVVVKIQAGGESGLGYTYVDACAAALIQTVLAGVLENQNSFDIPACWQLMQRSVRNHGRQGIAACAISAVDVALWDLKARHLRLPLTRFLGQARPEARIYGSGGFTSYSDSELQAQLSNWVEREGCRWVKMKIGSEPERDPHRALTAKHAIGDHELFVDANGAFSVKQAVHFARAAADADIRWFEEPVTSDDVSGLRTLRTLLPNATEVAAGEYIYTLDDARRLLEGGCVDVLQADVTRCGGITGFLAVGVLSAAHHIDLSGHCAPAIHCAVGCAVPRLRHLEWFHDHVRIERMLFDGAPQAADGAIRPDLTRHGHGLQLKEADAERYAVSVGQRQ
jgi:L-alanine-DL-glutamate epimerase-like enolase superfamily enzyme